MDCNCNNNYYVDENGERHTDIPMGTSPQAAYARTNLRLKNKVEQLENEMADVQEALTQTEDNVNQSMESLSDSIHQDLDEMSENIETGVNTALSGINARVDNIIAHNNDTEGNTELVDIRTGVDGTVYASAGSAVRTQISVLNNLAGIYWEDGFINSEGINAEDNARKRTSFIPCPEGITIIFKAETDHDNVSALTAYNDNKQAIGFNINIGTHESEHTYSTPTGTKYIRLSSKKHYETYLHFSKPPIIESIDSNIARIRALQTAYSNSAASISNLQNTVNYKNSCVYIAVNGSDSNDGSYSHPFATVDKALQCGAEQIMIKPGIYEQNINLQNAVCKSIKITNSGSTGRVIFRPSNCLLASSEQKLDGYNNIYLADVTATFAAGNNWIFQDGVSDINTLITDTERHPLQRGYQYRCEDTKITRCTSNNLADAITEIENSENYKWYYDPDHEKLYFSRPQTVTNEYPLRASFGGSLFSGGNRALTLNISGIETKYINFNITGTSDSKLSDCKSSNVFASSAFNYSGCLNAEMLRCEAVRCFSGTGGDGFNAHSTNSGDIYSKQTTVTLTDCWSHDNNDDGYSDHERSETTIIGGLYEYNGKVGITPSFGSHCTCYNVCSRNNNNGFYYIGTVETAEGGKYGQLYCSNCCAENNSSSGFRVDGTGNSAILFNCQSFNNYYGYQASSSSHGILLSNCRTAGCRVTKSGNISVRHTEEIIDN